MPPKTEVGIITAVDSVNHWFDDSLYVSGDDDSAFLQEYDGIFDCGIYNNLETGTIDPYGSEKYVQYSVLHYGSTNGCSCQCLCGNFCRGLAQPN